MQRTTRALFMAGVLVLTLGLVAAPANAEAKPINGSTFLEYVGPPEAGCNLGGGLRGWVGTAEINGETYGWADFTTDFGFKTENHVYFEEYWTIYDIEGIEDPDARVAASCDAERILMAGTDTGFGTPGMTTKAEGVVETATGAFADVEIGSRMFYRGKLLDEAVTKYSATLHIH